MAYVGHSPVREYRNFGLQSVLVGQKSAFVKSALLAMAAAAAIIALSDAGGTATESMAMAKADRLSSPRTVAAEAGAGYAVDASAGTTTVERGAATPLSLDSPFRGR